MEQTIQKVETVITPAELLQHWQGHRELTRRVIEAFPEKEFFEFSIGGMRPFADMCQELLGIAVPGLLQILSGHTSALIEHLPHAGRKENILKYWDEATVAINNLFAQIPPSRFHETIHLFGKYENTIWSTLYYFIDNEIHHRGQGYVYLRALGIEPPPFWDRP